MSTQLVLGVAGAAVGFAVGGPSGAQWGWALGSVVGGVVGQPDGPGPGDLSAPQLQQGASLPRVYGRVRVPVNPAWVSEFRATANETGGKGGPPEGSAGYSYDLDLLGTLADGSNVIAMTRIWVNKKLVWTALEDSTDASLAASAITGVWAAVELFTGTPSQTPWAVYETSVTTPDAVAYRNLCSIGFTGLQCGGSKTPPLVEVEIITQGSQAEFSARTRLQSYFAANDTTDISAYAALNTTGSTTGDGGSFAGGAFTAVAAYGATTYRHQYESTALAGNGVDPFTVEFIYTTTLYGGSAYHVLFEWCPNTAAYATNFYRFIVDSTGYFLQTPGLGYVTLGALLPSGVRRHVRMVFGGTYTVAIYLEGAAVYQYGPGGVGPSAATTGRITLGSPTGDNYDNFSIDEFALRAYEMNSGAFTPPANIEPPDVASEAWTPATEDLQDIVDAELALNEAVDPADWDTTGLAGIPVRGFKAAGSPAQTIAQLADIFYFDTIPANPVKFVVRGQATVGTIPFADTGVGVDQPGKPFTGLKRGNNDEVPAVVGLQYPNILQDHEAGFERGDRLTTDGPDIRKAQTPVVLEPDEAKGRAITATLMARAATHTAAFAISDKYAKAEPGDAFTVTADDDSTFSLIIPRLTYADGVKSCDWLLNDTSALVETGITDVDYTPSIIVATPPDATLVALDVPILRDADNDPGAYTAVIGAGTVDFPGAQVRRSIDDVDFSEVAATHTAEATIGATTTTLGNWAGGYVWDEVNSVTVVVGEGQTLASSTADAMQANVALNVAFIGAHGRWETIRFRTATLVSAVTYTLTGLLRGVLGTEAHMGTHTSSDTFVLATSAALRRVSGEVATVGATRYLKGVTVGRSVASVASQSFVNNAVGLLPFSPNDLRASRNGSNDVTFTWSRRTRLATRYGGAGGSYTPLGEDSERYELDVYASGAYAAVLRTISVTSQSASYTASQQTSDGLTPGNAVYVRVYQLSAAIGRGSKLQASA